MHNENPILPFEENIQFPPTLAAAIGVNEAIVLSRLHWLLGNKKNGKEFHGERWIFNTYEQWQEQYFPFWSTKTILRIFNLLELAGLVISCQPEGTISRRKYYRVSKSDIQSLTVERFEAARDFRKTPNGKKNHHDKLSPSERFKLSRSSYSKNKEHKEHVVSINSRRAFKRSKWIEEQIRKADIKMNGNSLDEKLPTQDQITDDE